jgi:hypothetical protein
MSASRISNLEESLDSLNLEEAQSLIKQENRFTCFIFVNKSSGKPFVESINGNAVRSVETNDSLEESSRKYLNFVDDDDFDDYGFDSGFNQGLIYTGFSKLFISYYLEGSGIIPEFSESEAVFAAGRNMRLFHGEGILLPPLSLCTSLNKLINDAESINGNAVPPVETNDSLEESSRKYLNFVDDDDFDDYENEADDDYY